MYGLCTSLIKVSGNVEVICTSAHRGWKFHLLPVMISRGELGSLCEKKSQLIITLVNIAVLVWDIHELSFLAQDIPPLLACKGKLAKKKENESKKRASHCASYLMEYYLIRIRYFGAVRIL